jgi:PAS domain S-box-containing protein
MSDISKYRSDRLSKFCGTYMKVETESKKNLIKKVKLLQNKINLLEKANLEFINSKTEEILQSEEKYHNIFNESLDGLFITSPEGKILDINKRCLMIFGYDNKEEIDNIDLAIDVYAHPVDRQRILSMVNSQGSAEYEAEYKKKNGEIIITHNSLVAVKDSSGEISSYRGIVRDISRQKNSEKALQQLNRELRAISNCNQTLLRAEDEQTLLNEICRIICDEAGYRLAWVGYVEHDEAKTVRPVAWAGFDSGYIAEAKLTWADDAEHGQGPTGKAIRSGKVIYTQNFITDPQMNPWRESAILHGYCSSMALPLKDESAKVFGVLQIYSSEPNAITPDEIRLSEELASDLAFGITALRNRTERKRMKAEAMESDERFRLVFENVYDGISIYCEDTDPYKRKLIECNERYAMMAGRSREELLRLGSTQELQITLENMANTNRLESLKGDKSYRGSFSWIRPDGKDNVIEYMAMPIIWRGNAYSIAIDRDITERKKTENELRKLSRAVEQSPVSIIITDTDGNIEYVNPKVTEITGYQFAELVGKNPRIFSSGEHPKSDYKILWDTITSGKEWHGELHNKKNNGELYWEFASISPTLNEKGEITNFIALKEDITERKRILEELIAAKEKAEQSDKLKTEFLSQVSHEIRTPLIYIINYTDLINDNIKEGNIAGLPEYLESLSEAGERIQRTFDLIINAAQILTNNFEPKFITVNLVKDVLLHVYNVFKDQAKHKGLDFTFSDNSKDKNILADEYCLNQLFSNLFDNAIKYTKEGFVKIEVTQKDKTILVKTIDTGIGISKDFLPHIFELFRQEEQGYSRKYEGNGLGLVIAKKYCEMNNAEIEVESIKGKGSIFTVKFELQN